MSKQAKSAEQGPQEVATDISCMLLNLQKGSLVLPGVSIAEIVGFSPPEQDDNEESPEWFMGKISWREQSVPLVSYENMNNGEKIRVSEQARIAVLNNTGKSKDLPFFAILVQDIPRLVRLSSGDVNINDKQIDVSDTEKLHIVVNGEKTTIPNIEYIEKALISYLKLS